ncbi:hypothetical protein [Kitasatospora sp. CB02891]|uniref:hypothetical protein n=1 Tax=Kitasatospora sp. CB02891 TaxID=2020329 RepID=UPI000C27EA97|nr:hypothetical protein [Kitasatospora sp. CB02891]PJN29780.1 hypothetical protein CG736_04490 [Kitasatospora sp. CB02891]
MRRRLTGIGLLAAAGVLALSTPAQAATGLLVVNGVAHHNPPRGCYSTTSPVTVENFTDSAVLVHAAANCQGPVTAEVDPGKSAKTFGVSYFVL